jgi:phage/plasmid primase-like uncharacterized protein
MSNKHNHLESSQVREAVKGRWVPVLAGLCPELEPALAKPGRHVGCPVHGGRDGFRLFPDVGLTGGGYCNTCGASHDGFSLLQWLKGWSFPETLEAVDNALGGSLPATLDCRTAPATSAPGPSDGQTRERLRRTWSESVDWRTPASKPLRDYLANRGLDASLLAHVAGAIRFHQGLRYYDEDKRYVGTYPALLALVSDADGKPVTIHRIYLTAAGRKAPVEAPKKMMSIPAGRKVMGGAIRLGELEEPTVVDIAEGIETALAVRQAMGMPVWSVVNATLLAGFVPPVGTRHVRVWCDLDRPSGPRLSVAGHDAAVQLRDRLAADGITVEIRLPPEQLLGEKKADWLDVLNALGVQGFPAAGR